MSTVAVQKATTCMCILVAVWVLLCQTAVGKAENGSMINLGAVLTTDQNSTWFSRNGTFALGFHPVGRYTYTLSIWYAAIPVRTVVWTANRNNLVIEGATLTFRNDGNLVLMDSLQTRPVWQTNTSLLNVFTAELLDSGNFVMRDAHLDVVWQSFDDPSDTLLPDQKLSAGMQLVSSQTNRNAALGRYSLRQDAGGNLRLYYLPSSVWYWSATLDDNIAERSFSYLNSSGFFSLYNNSGSILASWMTTDVGPGPLRHLKLGVGGDLRVYSWSADLASWRVVWKALNDECSVINLCGTYGLCSYQPNPICTCPMNFALVDPDDYSQGCQPSLPLNCTTGSSGQKFLQLDNIQYEGEVYTNLQGISEADCMDRCSEDCACLGIFYFYNGNGTCSLKSQQQSGHIDATGSSYIKVNGAIDLTEVNAPTPSSQTRKERRSVRPQIVAAIVCAFSLALFLLAGCCFHWWKQARKHKSLAKWMNSKEFIPGAPTRFSFKDLQVATLNFSMKLGAGDFGTVYKGVLPDGTPVAVKHLETSQMQGDKQFRAEVAILGSSHHQNLVRLYGFCCEGTSHRLLVYEFVANGSLDKFIFAESKDLNLAQIIMVDSVNSRVCLDWKKRFKAILGTARALAYLHEQCGDCILHCRINTENILLDENFEAKVSDFGISKIVAPKAKQQTKGLTYVKASVGHLAPECLLSSLVTTKSDVYSFGMVVLEVVSGRRNLAADAASTGNTGGHRHRQRVFSDWGFYRALAQGKPTDLVDRNLGRRFDTQEAERAVKVAAWCVQDDPACRPSMGKVVLMLEGIVAVPSPLLPRPPFQKNLDHSSQQKTSDSEAATPEAPTKGVNGDGVLEFDLNSPLISKMD